MKTYPCEVCKGEMNLGMCQSGVTVEGVTKPAHVGCADEWANEKVTAWTIVTEDYGYTSGSLDCVMAELDNMEEDGKVSVERRTITRAEFEAVRRIFKRWPRRTHDTVQ